MKDFKLKKVYTGTLKLGSTTPSFDLETEINKQFPTDHINENILHTTSKKFLGEIEQYPPIYSAIKNGKRLYEYARKGEKVEIKARKVHIQSFNITGFKNQDVDFEIHCSKGTYIRSLVNDFGKALNSGAHLLSLRRTKIGAFSVDNALKIEEFIDTIEVD